MGDNWKYLFLKEDGTTSVRKYKHPLPKNTVRVIYTPEFIWDQSDEKRKEYFNRVDRVEVCLNQLAGKEQ